MSNLGIKLHNKKKKRQAEYEKKLDANCKNIANNLRNEINRKNRMKTVLKLLKK